MQHSQRTTAAKQTAALQLLSKIVQLMGLEHLQSTLAESRQQIRSSRTNRKAEILPISTEGASSSTDNQPAAPESSIAVEQDCEH
jgi:hypothetical protein